MSSAADAQSTFKLILSNVSGVNPELVTAGMGHFARHIADSNITCMGQTAFQAAVLVEFMNGSHSVATQLGDMGYPNFLAVLLEASSNKAVASTSSATLCLQSLTALSTYDGNFPLIAASGAVEAVVGCVEAHHAAADVAEYGFLSLQSLLAFSDEARDRFLRCGGVEVTVAAMGTHTKTVRVQALGARVLANCTICLPAARERVLRCGGIEAIIRGMVCHRSSEAVQISGCNSLGTVAIRNKLEPLIRGGGIEAIIQALEAHPDNVDVQKNGVYALGNITSNNKKCIQTIIAKGSVDAIFDAMERHPAVYGVVVTACYSLSWIFSRQDIYEEYFTPDILAAAEAALARFPADKPLRQRVDSLRRKEDPRAAIAREQGVCSNVYIKRCGRPNCGTLKKYYCEECCAPQWAYECHTCLNKDGHPPKFCVSCWNKFHKGHSGTKVFITTICETPACSLTHKQMQNEKQKS